MDSLNILSVFLSGLILGSFFNVVGLSVPKQHAFVNRRSACPNCDKTLSPLELIPILSYMFQGGKCRSCKARISPLYPLVELLTGVLFAFAYWKLGASSELILLLVLISLFMIIFVSDIAYMIIPDKVLLFFVGLFLLIQIFFQHITWWNSILGAATGFGLLLLIAILSKGGMGGGDIKLFAVIGFVFGVKMVILAFIISTFYGAVIGIIGILLGFFKRKTAIPFGPYIVFGSLTAFFYGEALLNWYLEILGW